MRLFSVLLFSLPFGAIHAQEPAPLRRPSAAVKTQQLLESLGSKDYKERERASKELAAEGDRALPYLKSALGQIESPEVQRRIEVLVERLNSERIFRPSLVSVDCENASYKTVLKDLCKQAGYEYRDGGTVDKKIALKLANAPFWEAMDAIADSTGVTIVPADDEQKSITAYDNESVSPHNFVSGPFKFTASNINSSRSIQLANLPRRGRLTSPESIGMGVQIFAEPKLPIVGVGQVTLLKAVDDKGSSLLIPTADDSDDTRRTVRLHIQNNYRSLNQSCGLNFNRGNRDAVSIQELHARVALSILVEERPEITVENILEAGKKKFAGDDVDLEIEEVGEAMGAVSLKLTFRQRSANWDEYGWSNGIVQRLTMLDDKGNKMVSRGVSEQNSGVGILSIRTAFGAATGKKAGRPSKLILNEWVTEARDVEFKFKNIPLP